MIQGIFLLFGFMNLCPIHILKYLLLNEKYPISLFEYKQVQKYLRSIGEQQDNQNQDEIYKAILHLREQLKQSRSLTRKQRRVNQHVKRKCKSNASFVCKNEPEIPSVVEIVFSQLMIYGVFH